MKVDELKELILNSIEEVKDVQMDRCRYWKLDFFDKLLLRADNVYAIRMNGDENYNYLVKADYNKNVEAVYVEFTNELFHPERYRIYRELQKVLPVGVMNVQTEAIKLIKKQLKQDVIKNTAGEYPVTHKENNSVYSHFYPTLFNVECGLDGFVDCYVQSVLYRKTLKTNDAASVANFIEEPTSENAMLIYSSDKENNIVELRPENIVKEYKKISETLLKMPPEILDYPGDYKPEIGDLICMDNGYFGILVDCENNTLMDEEGKETKVDFEHIYKVVKPNDLRGMKDLYYKLNKTFYYKYFMEDNYEIR